MIGNGQGFEAGPEPDGYKQAVEELDGILAELENDDIDVDVLASRVRRAGELLTFCKRRITETRYEIESVISEIEAVEAEIAPTSDSDPWGEVSMP